VVGFRPELYKNWYGIAGENDGVPTAADNDMSSGKIIRSECYDQSIMAEIKSAPWLVSPKKNTRKR